ncbi:MAG: LysE family transporter [Flavobacteriaceae bacterium]|nr:LysE family transporter [Flavobacteriaceae bacterium]
MTLLLPFIYGFSTSFIGMLAPSMLNMTTVKISMERGMFNAMKFALGVSIIVFIQAYIALFFIKFLKDNPDFIQILQKIALIIFVLLSIYFYKSYKTESKNTSDFKQKCKDTFVIGLLLSTLNMFAIPFYYGITTMLSKFGWLQLSQNNILLFVIGSAIGTFMLLYTYSNFAKFLKSKSKTKSNKLNLTLSLLTGFLALVTLVKLF